MHICIQTWITSPPVFHINHTPRNASGVREHQQLWHCDNSSSSWSVTCVQAPLQSDFAAPCTRRWALFLHPLNLMTCFDHVRGRSDFVRLPRLGQKRTWTYRSPGMLPRPLNRSSLLEDKRSHGGEPRCPGGPPPRIPGKWVRSSWTFLPSWPLSSM